MTLELINTITVGLALAGLIIGLFAWLRHDIREQNSRLDNLRQDSNQRLSEIRDRLSRLEGLIEGLFHPRTVTPQPTPDQHDQAA